MLREPDKIKPEPNVSPVTLAADPDLDSNGKEISGAPSFAKQRVGDFEFSFAFLFAANGRFALYFFFSNFSFHKEQYIAPVLQIFQT